MVGMAEVWRLGRGRSEQSNRMSEEEASYMGYMMPYPKDHYPPHAELFPTQAPRFGVNSPFFVPSGNGGSSENHIPKPKSRLLPGDVISDLTGIRITISPAARKPESLGVVPARLHGVHVHLTVLPFLPDLAGAVKVEISCGMEAKR